MARATIPDALEMRRLKYAADVPLEAKDRVADALRAAGRRSEALLLYDGRADHPSLLEDLAWAVREGASFTLSSLKRMGVPVTDEQLRACAESAEAKGRWYDAYRCYERLADEASLARVRERLPNFKVAIPENKKE